MHCTIHIHSVILFVVTCALILIFNIGIPSELRGCFFFIQVAMLISNTLAYVTTFTFKVVGFVYQYRAGDKDATWVSLCQYLYILVVLYWYCIL